jgi:hypothetical protein
MADDTFIELGPHKLVWIEPAWKDHPSLTGVRSAGAIILNVSFLEDPFSVEPVVTWIPLGRHKIVL